MTPSFHPLADAELTDAAAFLQSAARGLGEEFLQEIARLLALFDVYPEVGQVRAFGIRTLASRGRRSWPLHVIARRTRG